MNLTVLVSLVSMCWKNMCTCFQTGDSGLIKKRKRILLEKFD